MRYFSKAEGSDLRMLSLSSCSIFLRVASTSAPVPFSFASAVVERARLKAKVTIKVQAISKGALEAATAAGGSFEKTDVPIKQSDEPAAEAAQKK